MFSRFKRLFIVILVVNTPCYAIDTVVINEDTSLFSAIDKTVPVVTSKYVGWTGGWQWAKTAVSSDHKQQQSSYIRSTFTGRVENLDIDFSGATQVDDKAISWTYDWNKNSNVGDAIGFGLEFNLTLDSQSFSSQSQSPEFIANNKGWRWKTPNGQTIEVTFSPELSQLYFVRGQKNTIRALFFTGIAKGAGKTVMTVKMSNTVSINGPVSLEYGNSDESQWHKDVLPTATSPIDLSFLNNNDIPAGRHGFVVADKDQLYFEDNTPAKFWGTNVQAYALFSSTDADIKQQAKRIAALGYNLVRIHHHDSGWVKPNIFKNPENNTLEFSDSALKKIDWWVKCLKDEGVYLWLDLHVGRKFTKNDGIEGFSDFAHGGNSSEARGFNYYNKDVQALMKAFNEAYLNHVNPFTQIAYKDDPAVIALLITNENDLTQHFGNALLADKNVPVHNALFSKDAEQFSKEYGLTKYKTEQTWLMGESKTYLNDVEHRFNQQMIDQLDEIGVKSLVATTNSWGGMGLFGLPSLTDGSIIDTHSYGKAEEFRFNPRYKPGFLTWIGGAQVSGKPLSVTEWNIEPFPANDRFTAPIYTASIASLQGWDAMMHYGYSQASNWSSVGGTNYSSFNDPAITGLMPAAALLYRQGHVEQAKDTYELKLSRSDFFFKRQDPNTSKTIRTLLETSRLTIGMPDTLELPWLKESSSSDENSIVIQNANQDFIPEGQDFVESDTKELKRDWNKGIHTINTAKSQVVSGWVGGETIALTDVTFKVKTKNAVVAVQSLENKPIRDSNKIFITAMARSKPAIDNKLPFISEPVIGRLEIYAPEGMKLYPINNKGQLEDKILIQRNSEGKYIIDSSSGSSHHWFVLQNYTPPFEITSSSPDGNEYVEGDLITFKTNATQQDKNIRDVTFWQDDSKLLGIVNKAPFELAIRSLTPGRYSIGSRVTFGDGTYKDARMTLILGESPFRITYPYDGDQILEGQPVVVKTNAINWGANVKHVEFWKDNWKYLHNTKSAPFEFKIQDLPLGEHMIRSRITYNNGTRNDSTIKINIANLANLRKNSVYIEEDNSPFGIVFPVDKGTYAEGESITFKTNAYKWKDNVRLVEYWRDGWKYLYGGNTSPYEFTLNELLPGEHLIRSRLTFKDGSKHDSEIKINIKPTADIPVFAITSPINNSTVSVGETITVKAKSLELSQNIDSVYFWYDDSQWLGRTNTEPYETNVSNLTEGKHIIRSRIFYKNGTSDLTSISITVGNASFRITSPANGSVFKQGEPIIVKTNATNLKGNVMAVHYWKDGWKWLARTNADPHEFAVDNLTPGEHILRARVIFDDATTAGTDIKINVLPK